MPLNSQMALIDSWSSEKFYFWKFQFKASGGIGGAENIFLNVAYLGFSVMLIAYRELTYFFPSSRVGSYMLWLKPLHLPLFIFMAGHKEVILSSVQASDRKSLVDWSR